MMKIKTGNRLTLLTMALMLGIILVPTNFWVENLAAFVIISYSTFVLFGATIVFQIFKSRIVEAPDEGD